MPKQNLELYIHIPFCMKKCDYCDFLSFPADERTQREYMDALLREIEYYGKNPKLQGKYEISTIFLGGGTPSWVDEHLLAEVLTQIRRYFCLSDNVEITMECNPGTVTRQKLQVYFDAGINRLSLGCQSADNKELKMLGRVHTFEQFLKTYELARSVGFENINVDLISALPYQTGEMFYKSIQSILRLKPEHISVYALMIEPGTKFYELYKFDDVKQHAGMETEALPTEDEAYRIYKITQQTLIQAGYQQYEISNYAKPGFACRHNIGYWRRENYLGLGLGAASLVDHVRYANETDLYKYIEGSYSIHPETPQYEDGKPGPLHCNLHASSNVLAKAEEMEEFMFLGLRMPEGIYRSDFNRIFGMDIDAVYHDAIEKLKREELLISKEGRIYLTDKGLDLSNYALADFLLH